MAELPVLRQDLYLASPWMNAAGSLGFAPPTVWPVPEPVGAFITNPISLGPRTPAAARGQQVFPGGVLIHSGLPNPGLSRVLRAYGERWKQSSLPVWVHLFGSNPDEIHQMVMRIEGREGVEAIELGLPPGAPAEVLLAFIEAAYGELPLVVNLPLTAVDEPWLARLPGLGVSAISLGAPRGALPASSGGLLKGRLYGPALFPFMLAAVQSARRVDLPVIAGAGVYRRQDAQALRDAGAWAVQLDTVLWRGWVE
jgi:dihydroorotate dehydrogenase (NAD+) catalytic subunit